MILILSRKETFEYLSKSDQLNSIKAFIIAQSVVLYVVNEKELDVVERHFTIDQVIWILYQQIKEIKRYDLRGRGNYQIYMTDTVRLSKFE